MSYHQLHCKPAGKPHHVRVAVDVGALRTLLGLRGAQARRIIGKHCHARCCKVLEDCGGGEWWKGAGGGALAVLLVLCCV
jgi:hypothetical protein